MTGYRMALSTLLDAFESFMREANWGASTLSADTIRKANEAPAIARAALATCPWCGCEIQSTRMERASDRAEVAVVACTGCEYIEEVRQ